MEINKEKKILLDADVIIHFFKGNQLTLLPRILPNEFYIIDVLYREVLKGKLKVQVENMLNARLVHEIKMGDDLNVLKEFSRLSKKFGEGESACLAYCKYNKDIVASSNLKDIKDYCNTNQIHYLTTLDLLLIAWENGFLDESKCDKFIYDVKSKGSKLITHINNIVDYQKMK